MRQQYSLALQTAISALLHALRKVTNKDFEVYFLLTILFFDIINIMFVIFKAQMVKQRNMN